MPPPHSRTMQGQGMPPEAVGELWHAIAGLYSAVAGRLEQHPEGVRLALARAVPHVLALVAMSPGPAAPQLAVAAARLSESWSALMDPRAIRVDPAPLERAIEGLQALGPRPDPVALAAVLAELSEVVTMAPPGPQVREATPAPPAPMPWARVQ